MSGTRYAPDTAELPTAAGHPIVDAVRIMPGPLGEDSPFVPADPEDLPLSRWHAWMDVVADREVARPTDRWTLVEALGRPPFPRWGLWWLTFHRNTGLSLLHRARVSLVLDGGEALVTACGFSLPWRGPDENVATRAEHPDPPPGVVQCCPCAEAEAAGQPLVATARRRRPVSSAESSGTGPSTRPGRSPACIATG